MQMRINMTARTPLAFRQGRDREQNGTLPYVPGSSLMGGLAHVHRLLRPDLKEEFSRFFLQERIRFSNCYPAHFQSEDLKDDAVPVNPLPATVRTCKRFGGFRFNADQEDEDRRGSTDALVRLALFALSSESRPDILKPIERYPCSGQPLDAMHGFFRQDGYSPECIGQAQERQVLRTYTGIDYETGTARSAILYSRHVLPRDSQFWGRWWVDDDLADIFMRFLHDSETQNLLRVGTGRTRGLGQIQFNAAKIEATGTAVRIQKRAETFSERFKQEAQQANIAADSALYIPLLCTSDVILHDPLARNRLQIEGSDLQFVGIEGAQLVFHAAYKTHIQGWNSLWGLPKADEWAIGMGSVFLLMLPNLDGTTYEALARLENQGLGTRRAEGFGLVSVANQIHIELMGDRFL